MPDLSEESGLRLRCFERRQKQGHLFNLLPEQCGLDLALSQRLRRSTRLTAGCRLGSPQLPLPPLLDLTVKIPSAYLETEEQKVLQEGRKEEEPAVALRGYGGQEVRQEKHN